MRLLKLRFETEATARKATADTAQAVENAAADVKKDAQHYFLD